MSVDEIDCAGCGTNGVKYGGGYTAYSAGVRTVRIDNQIVVRVRGYVARSLHRDSSALSDIASLPDHWPTAVAFHVHKRRGGVAVSIRIGFRIERLVGADVADDPGTLVGESCEGQSLAYVHYFLPVYLVA